jgi:hypothetical protein
MVVKKKYVPKILPGGKGFSISLNLIRKIKRSEAKSITPTHT